jgi:hypothetical protein
MCQPKFCSFSLSARACDKRAIWYRLEARGGLKRAAGNVSGSRLLETKHIPGDVERDAQNDIGVVIDSRSRINQLNINLTWTSSYAIFRFSVIFLPPLGALSLSSAPLSSIFTRCVCLPCSVNVLVCILPDKTKQGRGRQVSLTA